MENIRRDITKLANQLRDELIKIPNVTLYGPSDPEQRTSIVSFNIKNQEPSTVVERLEKKNIILAVREISEEKLIRASPHFFNSEEQIEVLINELRKL